MLFNELVGIPVGIGHEFSGFAGFGMGIGYKGTEFFKQLLFYRCI